MLPSGISIRTRENLVEGAARTQTTLIIDPIVTLSGDRVTMSDIGDKGYGKIDQGNSREELISWTGITDNTTTYTLTGVVWGVNFHNLLGSIPSNMKKHNSGANFSINTDMHYIAEQFVSSDDFNVNDNSLGWGDGTDTDKTLEARNGDVNVPYMRYDASLNKWVISNDGVNSYDPEQGGSGLVAGHGIDINGGAIDVDLSELTTDTALDVTSGQIVVKFDESTLVENSANGIKNVVIQGDPQAAGYLTGGTSVSSLSSFVSILSNSNDGKFKINVDGTVYDNVNVDLSPGTDGAVITQDQDSGGSGIVYVYSDEEAGQSFTMPAGVNILTSVSIYGAKTGSPTGLMYAKIYLADANDFPTGSALASTSVDIATINTILQYHVFEFNIILTPSTKYCVVLSASASFPNNINSFLWTTSIVDIYAGGRAIYKSGTWSGFAYERRFKVNAYSSLFDYDHIATATQSAIRTTTSNNEVVAYSTDHFVITSSTANKSSQILKLMTPSTGTDISGSGATSYLDLGTNAVETLGTGDDNRLVKTDANGKVSSSYLTGALPAINGDALTGLTLGYEIITVTDTVNYNTSKMASITLTAPAGKKVIGGGAGNFTGGDQTSLTMTQNYPVSATSWFVQVRSNSGMSATTVTGYAVCIKLS